MPRISRYGVLAIFCALFAAIAAAGEVASLDGRQTLSLDGVWEIVFDEANEGRAGSWQLAEVFSGRDDRREITVPSCWEEIEQDYEGVAFYGRRFTVPKAWEGRTVRVEFDAVNYVAEVWLNGHVVGRHEGGYGPFEFRGDDLLKYGEENFLSLRVIGPIVAQNKVIDGIGWSDMPHWRGAIAGGIWQSVRLVASGTVFVDDVFLEPRLADNTVGVQVTLENAEQVGRQVEVTVSIRSTAEPKDIVAAKTETVSLVPGRNKQSWTLAMADARYWSPDNPHLYRATVRLADGDATLDTEDVRFGMRELTIRDKKFELNGQSIYIKAAFFEGLYPTRLAMPDSPEMARREIELAKECGFNMIRPWRKPPPPMWLDLCDEMGVMVIGGMPIECMKRWPTVTPHLRDRIENEVWSAVLRDRNRACIVQWEIFNEIGREDLERLKHPVSMLARRLDPTRLILDESGGFAGGSNIYLPYQFEPEVFNDVHSYPGAPLNDVSYDKFLTLGKTPEEVEAIGLDVGRFTASKTTPGRLTVVSEIGYGSLPDLVDNNERFAESGNPLTPPYRYHKETARSIRAALEESGLDAVYPDLQKFCLDQQEIHSQGNKRMIEAIRSNSSTGGYAVHALTGGDWVLGAGLLDLFRNPKRSYWGTKEANQARYLALRVRPRNVDADRGAKISITGINDLAPVAGKLSVEVTSTDGTRVFQREQDAALVAGVSALFEEALDASELSGAYTVRTRMTGKDGAVVAENRVAIDVFNREQLAAPKAEVAVIDVNYSLRPFLKEAGIPFVEFSAETPKSMPVFVSKAFAGKPQDKKRFALIERFVREGGTVVYLETVLRNKASMWGHWLPPKQVLSIEASSQAAFGLWVGVSHVVTDHPVFEGLPAGSMMGQIYENVFAPHTLMGTGGEVIVGSVSHGWFQREKDAQNYLGPSAAWYGMDLGTLAHGEGRYVLSAMRIAENLGKDPVADKLLLNLIRWTSAGE